MRLKREAIRGHDVRRLPLTIVRMTISDIAVSMPTQCEQPTQSSVPGSNTSTGSYESYSSKWISAATR